MNGISKTYCGSWSLLARSKSIRKSWRQDTRNTREGNGRISEYFLNLASILNIGIMVNACDATATSTPVAPWP